MSGPCLAVGQLAFDISTNKGNDSNIPVESTHLCCLHCIVLLVPTKTSLLANKQNHANFTTEMGTKCPVKHKTWVLRNIRVSKLCISSRDLSWFGVVEAFGLGQILFIVLLLA